jgi:hypothetical protein
LALGIFREDLISLLTAPQSRTLGNIDAFVSTRAQFYGKTDFILSGKTIRQRFRRKRLCFVVSDFLAQNCLDGLRTLLGKHDLVALRIADGLENLAGELPRGLIVEGRDSESGRSGVLFGKDCFVHDARDTALANLQRGTRKSQNGYAFTVLRNDPVNELLPFFRNQTSVRSSR